jgi:predicted HTH transcriptional regulator
LPEPEYRPKTLPELIAQGEDQYLEFKASLMWDYRQKRVNKELYVPVMKNVAAFMNTMGGKVLIGIDDDGRVLGLEKDYTGMRKADPDGYENIFNMAFSKMIGAEFRPYVTVTFPTIENQAICMIAVKPSDYPVYFSNRGQEYFYIRTGNSSQALSISKATKYIRSRFMA